MTEISKITGLPELPEGYFWSVGTGPLGIFPYVTMNQHCKWGPFKWTKNIDQMWTSKSFDRVEDEIVYIANRIIEDQKRHDYIIDAQTRLSGDYPPKKLEK